MSGVDIAQLGLEIRSDGVLVATKNLDKLTKSARKAEDAAGDFTKSSARASTAADRLGQSARKTAAHMGQIAGRGMAIAVAATAALTANSIRLAVAAEETASKFQVVFRGSVEGANAKLVEMTNTIPLTITKMRGLASGVQDMLVPMGLAREEAAGLSVQAVQLAGDIASFNDVDAGLVLENIQSALAGSSEPLRKFGIDVRKSRLEAIALEEGLIGVGEEMNNAAIAQATFIAITRDSSDAMGDAARTMDSAANQMRFLRRDMNQAQEDLGQALIPAFQTLLSTLNEVDDDGFTPLTRTMLGIATVVLSTTQVVLLAVAGWQTLSNTIKNTFAIFESFDMSQWAELFAGGVQGIGTATARLIAEQASSQDESSVKMRETVQKNTEEMEKSLDSLFKTIMALGKSMDDMSNGADRSLADIRKGMDKTGSSAGKMSTEVIAVVREMNAAIDSELQDSFDFVAEMDFQTQADALQEEIDALNAGAEAWHEYQKAIFQTQEVAKLGPDATQDQIESIKKLSGELFNAQEAFGGSADSVASFGDMLGATIQSLEQVKNLFHEDSKEAESLRAVIQVLNVVLGVQAVIKQLAEGDVYSAIPRAIGVAALIASMGVQTGAAGSATTTRTRQEEQGTGSVLGDAEAKSESILKATEITADATSELVGINRGMLHALQALQVGIDGAVVQMTRGVGGVEHKALPGERNDFIDAIFGAGKFNIFGLNFIGEFLAKAFGGKVKLLDEGIEIEGGRLGEMVNDVLVRAFQEISVKKHVFDDTDIKKKFADLDKSVSAQFALIFTSMRDAVEQGAIALGIPLDLIQERLAAFEIATQTISFKDLTAEEQQEELLAVFSTIFDGLAEAVVPFIADFQKVGEGLGETLVRVATSVQVFQESVKALGFSADALDTEAFAHMAVDLVELTGGVENFISQFSTFFDKFASDEQKLEFATDQLSRAFESVGLSIPDTRDGMIDLMRSLDATTDAGRRQIAMLLNIAGVADEYYSLIQDGAEDLTGFIATQRRILADFTGSTIYDGLIGLRDAFNQAMDAADSLGASQREYAMIARSFSMQLRRMAAELTLSIIAMTKQLFGDEMDGLSDTLSDGLENTREIANSVFDEWMRALEDIYDFTQSILLDEGLTTLTPAEQFAEAQSQFDRILAGAMGGDPEAAQALPDAAQALLEEARFMFASSQRYQDIFDSVLAALQSVEMPTGITPTVIVEDDTVLPGAEETETDVLVSQLEKFLQAFDLAGTLRDLSQVLNESVVGLAKSLNVPLKELVQLLGVELDNITLATAEGLAEVAVLLGADIFELLEVLDIGLHDLINELPGAIQDDLAPLLEAIEAATTEADATAAIGNLGDYILDLPADLQLQLAPLFELFRPADIAPELGALTGIEENTAATVAAIHDLINSMGGVAPVVTDPLDDYQPDKFPPKIDPPIETPYNDILITGTSQTSPAAPAPIDDDLSHEELAQIKTVLTDMRDQNRRYQEADLRVSEDMESSLKQQAEQTRRIANA